MLADANALPNFPEIMAPSGHWDFTKTGIRADQMNSKSGEVGASLANGDHVRKSAALKQRVVLEAKKFFVIFLYLWVMFGLFQLYNSLIDKEYHVTIVAHSLAIINALVFAKVMLLAESLHLGRRFEKGALIYPIAIKSLLFAVVFIAFHVAEKAIGGAIVGKTMTESLPVLSGAGLAGLLTLAAIVTISLVPFFTFKEVARLLGPGVLHHMILKARQAPDSAGISPDLPHRA